jgi:uncharacterized DUF497 family protein
MFEPAFFEWDDDKARRNLEKHRLAFSRAVLVFDDRDRVAWEVTRPTDGELRWKTVGLVDRSLCTLVFTIRGDVCRLISARRSNRTEERRYGDGSI